MIENNRRTQAYRKTPTQSLNPVGHASMLPQLRQGLNYLLLIISPLAAIVFRFDPIRGMWIGWLAVIVLLINHGAIPLIERLPQYLSGILLLLILIGAVAATYVETATGWVLCQPNQQIGGPLRPSALVAPSNPYLNGRRPTESDPAFIFFGSNAAPVPKDKQLDIVGIDQGPALISGMFASDGTLSLNAEVYDQKGVLLAEVGNSKPNAVGNVCASRPDLCTLVVQDFHKNELLYVHYLNPDTILIRGSFSYPGVIPVHVAANEMSVGRRQESDSCVAYNGRAVLGLRAARLQPN